MGENIPPVRNDDLRDHGHGAGVDTGAIGLGPGAGSIDPAGITAGLNTSASYGNPSASCGKPGASRANPGTSPCAGAG
jgi:hypothetical protein